MLDLNRRKEEFSLSFIHAISSYAGITVQRYDVDVDSVDCELEAPGNLHGFHSPIIKAQVKSTSQNVVGNANVIYDLPVNNYNDLVVPKELTQCPKILVLLVLPDDGPGWLNQTSSRLTLRRTAFWTNIQNQPPSENSNRVIYIYQNLKDSR